jgi:hypothetical protein
MKTYTHEELHKLDPAKLISHDGHREMTVLEVIRHLIDDDWPAKPLQTPTQERQA